MRLGVRVKLLGKNISVAAAILIAMTAFVACSPHSAKAPPVSLTFEEHVWLAQHPDQLTLFYNMDFPPLEFAASNGAFVGYGADIITEIEKALGVTFKKASSRDWNKHLEALESGDCAIAPTIVQTEERERYAYFTPPYATSPVVIIVNSKTPGPLTLEDLSGQRVALVSGFATERYVRECAGDAFEIVLVHTVAEGLREVAFGQVDAFVENLAASAYFIKQEGLPNLRVAGSTDYSYAYSIGVSRKYPLLFSAIEKALEAIPAEKREAIRTRWISLDTTTGLNPRTKQMLETIGIFAAFLLGGLTAITIVLKRRLNQKVVIIERAQQELMAQTERLRESENLNRALFDQTVEFLGLLDIDGRIIKANRTSLDFIGKSFEEIEGALFSESAWWLGAEQGEALCREALETARSGETFRCEVPHRDAAGNAYVFDFSLAPLRDDNGVVRYFIAEGRDITPRKQAEAEREMLQEKLLQAQKMEAVGRLAGGVAHDFNNMLQAILGHADLVLDRVNSEHPIHADLLEIRKAAERSADLTRQLLAFARKQTVAPRVLDLNETVDGMFRMLRRLIGEDIELLWNPGFRLWPLRIDPAQVDQILANLCVNARDAISGVGRVLIETDNRIFNEAYCARHSGVIPGDYVMLSVSDTGRGMDKDTLANIFEPFFTTKEFGRGTGLGLATVYGAVKQNNGFITVDSAPEKGTTFRVYFPRYAEKYPRPARLREPEIVKGQGESVLLVEDDPSILNVGKMVLENLGYVVTAANTPGEALRVGENLENGFDLLITDVVMPEMNGKELAARLCAARPGLKCLFMSGYTADVIAHHGVLNTGIYFLQKPFTKTTLAAKLREILNGASGEK